LIVLTIGSLTPSQSLSNATGSAFTTGFRFFAMTFPLALLLRAQLRQGLGCGATSSLMNESTQFILIAALGGGAEQSRFR
jgi:hypothetical protein